MAHLHLANVDTSSSDLLVGKIYELQQPKRSSESIVDSPSAAVAENEVLKRRKTNEQHNDRKRKEASDQLLWRLSENGVKSADSRHCQSKRLKWKGTGVDSAAKASNSRRRGEGGGADVEATNDWWQENIDQTLKTASR